MRRSSILALVLGSLSVLGFAPFEIFPVPLVALAILFHSWQQATTPRRAAWLGFCYGMGLFLAGVSWVYVSLHDVGGMATPVALVATAVFCAYLALFPALAGYLFRRLMSDRGWSNSLLAAALWTLCEWFRGTLFTGFPWLALGYSQAPPSPLFGFAPLVGSYGVGLIAAFLAATLVFNRCRGWIAMVVVVGLLLAGHALRNVTWTEPVGEPFTVSLLQGNVPQSLKWNPAHLPLSIETYTRLALDHPAELTVLPETAIPLFFDQVPRETLDALRHHGSVLIGTAIRHRDGGYVNGAVAVTRASASAPTFETYAKRHLVPFGEYVPPGFSWFFDLVRIPMSDFAAGPAHQAPLSVAGQQLGPNICYEDLFGEEIISALPRATLLVNLSNTAWFGDSLAQPQHLQIARMRAMETGRMMLRATNTGITAAIAPDGRVLGQLPPFAAGALQITAQGYIGLTPYARWGNLPALLMALIPVLGALLPACLAAYRKRRSR